ncbi:MAG: hypothetical protein OI74_02250 [Gammaproteobacteria bacterium (ex Lamellibrachia satsuma)]|nr:MAG: hypothetical protein NV67_14685 [Gammaproteobacteria bacterium (ex Lamellibrachia satsuma)]RRS35574.1 MAG: hypothetical protein OI74_02250 [Gammaproteobacteria bacterium (ex Lamellibrachia satsuma)]
MPNIVLGLLYLVSALLIFSIMVGIVQHMLRKRAVSRLTAGMSSGVFIAHGMVIDPETGLVSGQKKASLQAYSRF